MVDSVKHLKRVRENLAKALKFKGKGIPPYNGFNISIGYGGNKEADIANVSIGSISDEENAGKEFFDLVIKSLENSEKFWIRSVQQDLTEISTELGRKTN